MVEDVNCLRGTWTEPNDIWFGVGRISELNQAAACLGMTRPLVVTDPGLAGSSILRQAMTTCQAHGLKLSVFSDIKSNPSLQHARGAAGAYRQGGHDGIIAFGGGTSMEVAKVAALLIGEERSPWDFEVTVMPRSGPLPHPGPQPLPPLVAVPTTAGSGAEARAYAVIKDQEGRRTRKKVLRHPGMLPGVAIIDPALTTDLPPILTAATGMNALAHNLEAYCTSPFDPACQGMAAEGVRLVRTYLTRSFRNGSDLVSRGMVMAAASLGGMVFRRGLGAVQALADPIAAARDTHHGLAAAVLTPYVLAHNRPVVEERIVRLSAYVGLEPAFEPFLECLLTMRAELGIPHTLRGLGMDDARIATMVEEAAADPFAGDNPLPLTCDEIKAIYRRAMEGDLT
ncbi:iron-containing alcohol dehydrogenase [Indioceanicola profundi]|uniref:iron-containing alcohol dehydrogenase n=1 Tax=Indioceanicola profundi TaxID=2220096 RepID=UPI000E6AAE8B|nr:iron-containing alcohol dehydrogenase [Indioceanicola profundi]